MKKGDLVRVKRIGNNWLDHLGVVTSITTATNCPTGNVAYVKLISTGRMVYFYCSSLETADEGR